MTNELVFTTYSIYDNIEIFEQMIEEANTIWKKTFDNYYEKGMCPFPYLKIGRIDNQIVCTCIFESYSEEDTKISCVASYPQNKGYGTRLMEYVINYIKNNISDDDIIIYIDNDKLDKLSQFYKKFGFEFLYNDE